AHSLSDDHERFRHLTTYFVFDADHGDFLDLRMLAQRLLDLARINIFSCRDDEILLAAGDAHKPLVIKGSEIAGVKPAVADRFRCLFGYMMVTLHYIPTANHDLTDFAWRQNAILIVPNCYLNTGERRTDRSGFINPGPIERNHRRCFGLSITFIDRHFKAFFETFSRGGRERFTSGNRK